MAVSIHTLKTLESNQSSPSKCFYSNLDCNRVTVALSFTKLKSRMFQNLQKLEKNFYLTGYGVVLVYNLHLQCVSKLVLAYAASLQNSEETIGYWYCLRWLFRSKALQSAIPFFVGHSGLPRC